MRRISAGSLKISKRLLQTFEILEAQHDSSRAAVLCDHDSTVLTLDAFHDLGQAVLHLGERHVFRRSRHGHNRSHAGVHP